MATIAHTSRKGWPPVRSFLLRYQPLIAAVVLGALASQALGWWAFAPIALLSLISSGIWRIAELLTLIASQATRVNRPQLKVRVGEADPYAPEEARDA